MRAYVITSKDQVLEFVETVGVTSSRVGAIKVCEAYLSRFEQGVITWDKKDKHAGKAKVGDHEVKYEMFFINQVNLD